MKYAILSLGALGDTICHYYRHNSIFGQIPSFKKNNKQSLIKVICCSSNQETVELFKFNPYIDQVEHVPWALNSVGIKERNLEFKKHLEGWHCLNVRDKLPKAKFAPPNMFLEAEEKVQVKSIIAQGKYILIHPFASYITKVREDRYKYIIDTMIDDLNYNVVVVGGSHNRSFQQQEVLHKEHFKYERDGLYNLVNKTNVRVAVSLAKNAYGYFGTWSAFYCAAYTCPAGPMVLCTEDRAPTIDLVNKKRFGNTEYKKIITPSWHIIPDLSEENERNITKALDANKRRIREQIIQHLGHNK